MELRIAFVSFFDSAVLPRRRARQSAACTLRRDGRPAGDNAQMRSSGTASTKVVRVASLATLTLPPCCSATVRT